ncbi:MT-A70-domain-containing protein [Aspergillus avenaceus]|uniref:MT-A70-domain-containing protein n=1 Tax=Aspergillus avenaceus TaxID=36643 RepID=A0A5N6TIY7_ASPAV|nr:MT-A70-domain-containing protein [Aspergillus avenaceus]
MQESAILYRDFQNTIFLLDIPTSITLAQNISPVQLKSSANSEKSDFTTSILLTSPKPETKHLISSKALTSPHQVSNEPKTDSARAKVLQRIPSSERVLHGIIEPVVRAALDEIKGNLSSDVDWCLERITSKDYHGVTGARHEVAHRKRRRQHTDYHTTDECQFAFNESFTNLSSGARLAESSSTQSLCLGNPPLILSPGLNLFDSKSDLHNLVVQNPSLDHAVVKFSCRNDDLPESRSSEFHADTHYHAYNVPPLSSFILCTLPISPSPATSNIPTTPIPGLVPDQKFDLVLLDPPWTNRSVRRSGHYQTQSYSESDTLTQQIRDILRMHLDDSKPSPSIAAIWITNSAKARRMAYDAIHGAGLSVCEEWVWVKTTTHGDPIMPLDGLWRKPYEVLILGMRKGTRRETGSSDNGSITRRVIAAVPDVHSRKPNLREIFENIFFSESSGSARSESYTGYSALEVFARNLTAGWWALGNEAWKFNLEHWWVQEEN